MYFFYNIAITLSWHLLKIPALFNPKLRLFIEGRREIFPYLEKHLKKQDAVIWVHTASLGEFEQGLPVIKQMRSSYPGHKILVTFFSPSGYEIKKNSEEASLITYLPMDTERNAERFLEGVQPVLAIFVKYEVWPNYLRGLKNRNIPTLMISGRFTSAQVFFKYYGGFMRKALKAFTHFFVQDNDSLMLLNSIGLQNVSEIGDTRFDRVSEILERDNSLAFMEQFKGNSLCLVLGSTWPEDEVLISHYLHETSASIKIVIAPHDIKEGHLNTLKESIPGTSVFYSEIGSTDISAYQVLVLDTIGVLTKVYSYADIAYVGGGFATGLHNTLEPAVFGIPVIIGPKYQGFNEAKELVSLGGISVVDSEKSFKEVIDTLLKDAILRTKMGKINAGYIQDQLGATKKILSYISEKIIM